MVEVLPEMTCVQLGCLLKNTVDLPSRAGRNMRYVCAQVRLCQLVRLLDLLCSSGKGIVFQVYHDLGIAVCCWEVSQPGRLFGSSHH